MVKVLDASALAAYLWKQPGYEKVRELLVKAAESERKLFMSTVNAGEVFYLLIRDHGLEEAARIFQSAETLPIEFIPVDLEMAQQAAIYKAIQKLPYADCFVAALAKLKKAELVTADKEFKAVEGEVKILWLNR